jgi:hypothetical protein
MNMHQVTGWDTAGAVGLLSWAVLMWLAVAVLIRAQQTSRNGPRSWQFWAGASVILLGLVGQIGHASEHFFQVGYWVGHPQHFPWMTPWGDGLARGFGQIAPSRPSLGMEILHLVGNFIFLAGLVGVVVLTRPLAASAGRRWGRMGVWMQGIHGLEHLSLTLSVAFGAGRAIGLSTWFGLIPPGPGLWTYRIWWHFLANLLGTAIFAVALAYLWGERRDVAATYGVPRTAPALGSPAPQPVSTPVSA